jgi:hypothetical protein
VLCVKPSLSKVEIFSLLLNLILIVGLGFGYVREKLAEAQAEGFDKATKQQVAEIQQGMDQRAETLKATVKAERKKVAQVKTPKQAVEYIDSTDFQGLVKEGLPDAPSKLASGEELKIPGLWVPGDKVESFTEHIERCKEDQLGLEKCEADRVDLEAQRDAFKADAEKWQQAAKGGSKFKRFIGATTKIAIGLGVGYTLGRVAR